MRPAAFGYLAPTKLNDVLALLDGVSESVILAGGQSIVPLLNQRKMRPALVVDINQVEELGGMTVTEQSVQFGALTRHRTLELNSSVASHLPVLAEAAGLIGDPSIRRRGTLGGSLAHAQPGAELPVAVVLLDGRLEIASTRGVRTVRAREFYQEPFGSILERDEVILAVRIDRSSERRGYAVREFSSHRHGHNIVGAAAIRLDSGGFCTHATVVIGCAGRPTLVEGAVPSVIGARNLDDCDLQAIGELAAGEHASAVTPVRSEDRPLVAMVVIAALQAAWQRSTQIMGIRS